MEFESTKGQPCRKTWLLKTIMKTFIFLCCSLAFALSPNRGHTQDADITIDKDRTLTVKQVFKLINKQADYKFIYRHDLVKDAPELMLKMGSIKVRSLLDDCLSPMNLTYEFRDNNTVVVKRKPKTTVGMAVPKASENIFQQSISGLVTDANGEPLPGANILEKGTTNGTQTDFDGKFTITVSDATSVLVISYIGFITQEIVVGNQSDIPVTLSEDAAKLEEVVVIGYGSVAKKELTGSVAEAKNIEDRAVAQVEEALQGNVSGVTVTSNGGDPTSTPAIKIRGVGTTSAESPLYIVDGVPYYGGPINPFDIESLTVLKDAASASIYGVRAAAGVILITTKKGKEGDIKVDFSTFTGVQSVANKPTALTSEQYLEHYNLAYDNSGTPRIDYFNGTTNPDRLVQRTNWVDEIFRNGIMQNYDVGIRGGSKKANFSSSLGYNKKEGILINTDADRISFRFNSTFQLSDKIKLGENFSYVVTNGQSAFTGTQASNGETNYNGVIAAAIKAPPFVSVYDADGNYSDVADGNNGDVLHPVGTLERINIDNPEKNTFGNLFLEYKPIDKLTLKTSYAINYRDEFYKEFDPRVPEQSKVQKTTNTLTQIQSKGINWSWENTLNYNTVIGDDHSLQLLGGYALQHEESEFDYILAQGFESEDPDLLVLPLAEEIQDIQYGFNEDRLVSFFSRAMYDYKKKYFLSASIRRDGTSKLSDDNRWENFPSVAGGWTVSNEDFFKSDWISNLKFRASWGRVGNIESLSSYPTNIPLSIVNVVLGSDGFQNGVVLDGRSNPDITWEISETSNFGLDFASKDNRWNLTADYFIKNTDRLLIRIPTSPLEGIGTSPFQNSGKVQNKGLELALGHRKYEGDFTYDISANVSFINNELVEIAEGFDFLPEGETQVATHFPLANAIGEPLYSFYLIESDGLLRTDADVTQAQANGQPDAQLGDIRFIDKNADGVINDDDRVFKGSSFPTTTYGMNMNFGYKNFDLSLFFQGAQGGYAYNGYKFTTTYPAHTSVAGSNLLDVALDTWHPGNVNASNPRLSIDDPNGNLRKSDFWLESTDYLRIKNLSVGYTWSDLPFAERLRFYATAQNLATWTNYTGLDPEVANRGVDGGQYPVAKTFTLGFNITLK